MPYFSKNISTNVVSAKLSRYHCPGQANVIWDCRMMLLVTLWIWSNGHLHGQGQGNRVWMSSTLGPELFVCYKIKIIFDLSLFPCISGRRVDGLWAWLFSSDKPTSAAQCPMIYRGYNRLYLISTHRLSSLLHYYQYIIFIIIFSYLFTWYWWCCFSSCKFIEYFTNISPPLFPT